MIRQILGLVSVMLLAVAPVAVAQDFCKGNFDYDDNVDGGDASIFKTYFGRSSYENPCPPDGPAPVPKTGQTNTTAAGDDGDLQRGVDKPPLKDRFTDNGDGSVTDNLTGLIWLQDANCFGERDWYQTLSDCNGLSNGSCGLTDDSSAGDWRLPNLFELESLRDMSNYNQCLQSGHPFYNVQNLYWSSTTHAEDGYQEDAWYVSMRHCIVNFYHKSALSDYYVWPVRGGH